MSEMSRRSFASGLAAAAGSAMVKGATSQRPNIVFICADEHGGPFLGALGHPIVKTPNLDKLATQGVLFRNAYCGSPVCVPGRAGMMSGMFPSDVGSYCNSTPFKHPAPTWGNRLRDAGYECWATGKLDMTPGTDYGFHEEGTDHRHSGTPDVTSLFRAPMCYRDVMRNQVNGIFRKAEGHDQPVFENALHFLRRPTDPHKPWAMYVGFVAPHPPFVAPPEYAAMYLPEKMPLPQVPFEYLDKRHPIFDQLANFQRVSAAIDPVRIRRARASYFGMITELDRQIGVLLEALDATGQRENTLVVYTSDHGEMLGENGLWMKNTLLENAARVPLIMSGAGMPSGKVAKTPVMHVDMVATMLEIAGVPHDPKLRGHSLVTIDDDHARGHPGFAYAESHSEGNCTGSFMIRKDHWKYIYATGYEPILFNLNQDPLEQHNLSGKPEVSTIQNEMHRLLVSLVPQPDAITEQAFAVQQELLMQMVHSRDRQKFREELTSRLGAGQALMLTNKVYGSVPSSR